MSVAGNLGPDRQKEGVAGEKLPMERQREESAKLLKVGRPDGEMLQGGVRRIGHQDEFYERVEEYDPVLRSHCRL